MITNTDLARAINQERLERRHAYAEATNEAGQLRRAIGRRLESLGKRLQAAPQPRRTGA